MFGMSVNPQNLEMAQYHLQWQSNTRNTPFDSNQTYPCGQNQLYTQHNNTEQPYNLLDPDYPTNSFLMDTAPGYQQRTYFNEIDPTPTRSLLEGSLSGYNTEFRFGANNSVAGSTQMPDLQQSYGPSNGQYPATKQAIPPKLKMRQHSAAQEPIQEQLILRQLTLSLHNRLTNNQVARIRENIKLLPIYDGALKARGLDPVKVHCYNRAKRLLQGHWNPVVAASAQTSDSTATQPTIGNKDSPILIEDEEQDAAVLTIVQERTTPTPDPVPTPEPVAGPDPAVSPKPVAPPKPKLTDMTDRIYTSSPPEEGDTIYEAYCTMLWIERYQGRFKFSRASRTHKFLIDEKNPKNFHLVRLSDGSIKRSWQLQVELKALDNEKLEASQKKRAELERRQEECKRRAEENAARKAEQKQEERIQREKRKHRERIQREKQKQEERIQREKQKQEERIQRENQKQEERIQKENRKRNAPSDDDNDHNNSEADTKPRKRARKSPKGKSVAWKSEEGIVQGVEHSREEAADEDALFEEEEHDEDEMEKLLLAEMDNDESDSFHPDFEEQPPVRYGDGEAGKVDCESEQTDEQAYYAGYESEESEEE